MSDDHETDDGEDHEPDPAPRQPRSDVPPFLAQPHAVPAPTSLTAWYPWLQPPSAPPGPQRKLPTNRSLDELVRRVAASSTKAPPPEPPPKWDLNSMLAQHAARAQRVYEAQRAREAADTRVNRPLDKIELELGPALEGAGADDTSRYEAHLRDGGAPLPPLLGRSRRVTWCSACARDRAPLAPNAAGHVSGAGADRLIYLSQRGPLQATCLTGCTAAAIASAISSDIAGYEAEASRDAAEKAAEKAEEAAAAQAAVDADEVAKIIEESDPSGDEEQPLEWLIPGLVPASATTVLGGASGSKKSWVAISYAICVAGGLPFLGIPVTRRRVLLLLQDDHRSNRARLHSVARGLGTSINALSGWLDVPRPSAFELKSDQAESMTELGRRISHRQYGLIVADNLSELRTGTAQSSESDATMIGLALRPLARLASHNEINGARVTDDDGGPAVVVLHHKGKDGELRGSTAILQHASYVVGIDGASPLPELPITLSLMTGCRVFWSGFEPIKLRFRGLLAREGEPPASVTPERVADHARKTSAPKVDPRRAAVMNALSRDIGVRAGAINDAIGGNTNAAIELRKVMESEGLIEQRDKLWYAR